MEFDATNYNAAISVCAQCKCWKQALELLENCKTWAITDSIGYSAAITACEKGVRQQHAVVLLQTMCSEKICPDTTIYNAAISACGRGKC